MAKLGHCWPGKVVLLKLNMQNTGNGKLVRQIIKNISLLCIFSDS